MSRAVVLLSATLLSACGEAGSNPLIERACQRAQEASPMSTPPAMAEGVFLQSLSFHPEGRYTGFRVFSDGRLERSQAGGPWTPAKTLPAEQVAALQQVLADAVTLEPCYRPAEPADAAGVGPGRDGAVTAMRFCSSPLALGPTAMPSCSTGG